MTMHAKVPMAAYIAWLKLNLDLLVVIYLEISNFHFGCSIFQRIPVYAKKCLTSRHHSTIMMILKINR